MTAAGIDTAALEAAPRPTFEELAEVGRFRWKDGRDIVVAVKRGPSGRPAVDVREVITRDAYSDSDFHVVGGSTRKPRRQREPYVGPTKVGFWLSGELAEGLADAIARAVVVLEGVSTDAGE